VHRQHACELVANPTTISCCPAILCLGYFEEPEEWPKKQHPQKSKVGQQQSVACPLLINNFSPGLQVDLDRTNDLQGIAACLPRHSFTNKLIDICNRFQFSSQNMHGCSQCSSPFACRFAIDSHENEKAKNLKAAAKQKNSTLRTEFTHLDP
jgi:hypothetical protein